MRFIVVFLRYKYRFSPGFTTVYTDRSAVIKSDYVVDNVTDINIIQEYVDSCKTHDIRNIIDHIGKPTSTSALGYRHRTRSTKGKIKH